jgi:hypothetical protein
MITTKNKTTKKYLKILIERGKIVIARELHRANILIDHENLELFSIFWNILKNSGKS